MAMVGDVIGVSEMCYVITSGNSESVCKSVERYEPGWKNAANPRCGKDELLKFSVVGEHLGMCVGLNE